MPLNDHEQEILDEIERQLYEEDPKLAEMVAKAIRGGREPWKLRLASAVFGVGAVVMLVSFTRSWAVAGAGFLVMVVSAAWIAIAVRSSGADRPAVGAVDEWLLRFQHRWRRDG